MTKLTAMAVLLPVAFFSTRIERVIKVTDPKVVKIGIVGKKEAGVCSGAVIDPEGTVLTCAHCFDHKGIQKVFIKSAKGEVYTASLLKIDFSKDLALIRANELTDFPYFAAGDEPKKGQQVLSFGSPLGLQSTDTIGWVDNLLNKDGHFIVHSAFISPGNSGGPLVDLHGRLIGINEATLMYGFFQAAQGMFIAIDIQTVKDFLKE